MAGRLDSGGSGGGTDSSSSTEETKKTKSDFETGSSTTTQDPNDGSGLESRGGTTTDSSSGGSSSGSFDDSTSSSSSDSDSDSTTTQDQTDQFVEDNYESTPQTGDAPSGSSQLRSGTGETAAETYNQGLEAGEGSVSQQAEGLEQQVLKENPSLEESQVKVRYDEDSNQLAVELDESGQRDLAEQRADQAREQAEQAGFEQPDSAVQTGGDGDSAVTYSDRELAQGEARERARDDIEQQLEEEGIDPANVDIELTETDQGFTAEISATDQEQFGDIDWSFGQGGPGDEVEQFIDEKIGEQGSEWVEENFSDPLRENTNPEAPNQWALAAANIAEEVPKATGGVLEAVELGGYLLEATPVAGGSQEQFDERVSQTGDAAVAVARSEAERAINNPQTYAAGTLLTFGAGRALSASRLTPDTSVLDTSVDVSSARRAAGTYSPDSGRFSTAVARTQSRVPDVSVERAPDRPTLDISPDLKRQIAERSSPDTTARDTPSPARIRGEVKQRALRTRRSASEAVDEAKFAVSEARRRGPSVSDARERVPSPSNAARSGVQEAMRVRRRAGEVRNRAAFAASQARDALDETSPRDLVSDVDRPDFSVSSKFDADLQDTARRAGREFERRRRRAQLEASAAKATAEEKASNAVNAVPSSRDLSDALYRSRFRTSEALRQARVGGELALRTQDTPSLGINKPSIGNPSRRLSDAAYRAKFRTSERLRQARVGAELSLRTMDLPDRPSAENPLGGVSEYSLRIGDFDSERTRTPDSADEFVADGFDVDEAFDDFDTDAESDTFEPSPEARNRQDGGGGQQTISVQQFRDDSTTDAVPETDTRPSRPRSMSAPAIATTAFADTSVSDLDGQSPEFVPTEDTSTPGTSVEPVSTPGIGSVRDVDLGTGVDSVRTPDTSVDNPTGLETETGVEVEQEFAQEQDSEVTQAVSTRLAGDSNRRKDLDLEAPGADSGGSLENPFGGDEQRYEFEARDLL